MLNNFSTTTTTTTTKKPTMTKLRIDMQNSPSTYSESSHYANLILNSQPTLMLIGFAIFLLILFILTLVLLVKNYIKNKKMPKTSVSRLTMSTKQNSFHSKILSNALAVTKNCNNIDRFRLHNPEIQLYFNEKIEKEGCKNFEKKLVDALNKSTVSPSQSVDLETHNILLRLNTIPIFFIKKNDANYVP